MLGRRESWPAMMILGIALVALAMGLKGSQGDVPVEPQWLMGAALALLLVVALVMAGVNWRWPVSYVIMVAAQAFLALLMGWGYSAVEGVSRDAYAAAQHGLWDYLPGTALQIGFAVALGAVAVAWFTRDTPEPLGQSLSEAEGAPGLPDLAAAEGPPEAVIQACEVAEVGAALLAQDEVIFAAGAWQGDPEAALGRVMALSRVTGPGLNTYNLDGAVLLVRWEGAHVVALTATSHLPADLAHELLRDLWAWEMVADEAPAGEAR
jgi:hypothetical protein